MQGYDFSFCTGGKRLDAQFHEFHISAECRRRCGFEAPLFASSGNVILAGIKNARVFIQKYNASLPPGAPPKAYLKAGALNAMGLIDEIFHYVCRLYRRDVNPDFLYLGWEEVCAALGKEKAENLLLAFTQEFPPADVYTGKTDSVSWLAGVDAESGVPNRLIALEELMLLRLANENPAFEPFFPLFNDEKLKAVSGYAQCWDVLLTWSKKNPPFGPEGFDLISMLKAPVAYSPDDLRGQLEYIRANWMYLLGDWLARLLAGMDALAEENKPGWAGGIGGGNPEMNPYDFGDISKEYERYSPDREWMPNVVLMAKSTLVWLSQLSKKYGRDITRLDQIPDEELDFLAQSGFTGLWLIGLWERSPASARIKQICGNPEAAASAYSLDDYDIAGELGGWEALDNLRRRAWQRGIRLASDMVPNHTGMDSRWVVEKPDLFVQTRDCPFPGYDFNGENLSHDGRVSIYLENHYYNKTDCAVVFKRVDNATGDTRYIYHGNDGTGMPWNDTAQIDFLNPQAREEVIQKILHVARNFPIIRFDAAMVLAKKHIQRLWYPEPGHGGDIASRSQFAITREEFEKRIPEEFWREVVDRCAREIPDTLLLAEAFWMMEGYFVRTLGMHRVYNSAFMNMLKREDNDKYRSTIKNTIEFDPEILKRYVNFMNNPDEETAVAQFGKGDKYFGVCTMMVAMPGLPMFGHGQLEGFEEKYGMEYRRAYRDERPDEGLLERHRREIFPLMKKRWLFAGVENFLLYDFYTENGVNENVFAWSNRAGNERALILYNNKYDRTAGWIRVSAASAVKEPDGSKKLVQRTLAEGLALTVRDNRFCVMQELRSGLWYLRSVRDLADKGMFAALDGFQTQVFMNLYEADDPDGIYQKLCDSLNGKGIADVFMGLQNIFLKDLYAAMADVCTPEYFASVRRYLTTGKDWSSSRSKALPGGFGQKIGSFFRALLAVFGIRPAKKPFVLPASTEEGKFIRSQEKPVRAFYETFAAFARGNYKASTVPEIARALRHGAEGFRFDTDAAWNAFAGGMSRLFLSPASVIREGVHPEVFAGAVLLLPVLDLFRGKISARALEELDNLWTLDRKISDILTDQGVSGHETGHAFYTLKVLLPFLGKRLSAETVFTGLFRSDAIREIMQVHDWDGETWFTKEAAEHMLRLLFAGWSVWGGHALRPGSLENLCFRILSASEYKMRNLPVSG